MKVAIEGFVYSSNIVRPDLIPSFFAWIERKAESTGIVSQKAIQSDFLHIMKHCDANNEPFLPSTGEALCEYIFEYRTSRSPGTILRCLGYVREMHSSLGLKLDDTTLTIMLSDLAKNAKFTKKAGVRHRQLTQITERLQNTFHGTFAKAILWSVYDSQFRTCSLAQVFRGDLKIINPIGTTWIPSPADPIWWERDGGFLPPTTVVHLYRWFDKACVTRGRIFPRIRDGRITTETADQQHLRYLLHLGLSEAGISAKGVSFRAVRIGALCDMKEADIGFYKFMSRNGIRSYYTGKALHKQARHLNEASIQLAIYQNRLGIVGAH